MLIETHFLEIYSAKQTVFTISMEETKQITHYTVLE